LRKHEINIGFSDSGYVIKPLQPSSTIKPLQPSSTIYGALPFIGYPNLTLIPKPKVWEVLKKIKKKWSYKLKRASSKDYYQNESWQGES